MQMRFSLGVLAMVLSASVGAQPLNTFLEDNRNAFPADFADYAENTNTGNANTTAEAQTLGANAINLVEGIGTLRAEVAKDVDNALISDIQEIRGKKIKSDIIRNERAAVKTKGFSTKKIPLWVKIAVPVVVIGGVAILISGGSNSSGSSDTGGIVDPPRPN